MASAGSWKNWNAGSLDRTRRSIGFSTSCKTCFKRNRLQTPENNPFGKSDSAKNERRAGISSPRRVLGPTTPDGGVRGAYTEGDEARADPRPRRAVAARLG